LLLTIQTYGVKWRWKGGGRDKKEGGCRPGGLQLRITNDELRELAAYMGSWALYNEAFFYVFLY